MTGDQLKQRVNQKCSHLMRGTAAHMQQRKEIIELCKDGSEGAIEEAAQLILWAQKEGEEEDSLVSTTSYGQGGMKARTKHAGMAAFSDVDLTASTGSATSLTNSAARASFTAEDFGGDAREEAGLSKRQY